MENTNLLNNILDEFGRLSISDQEYFLKIIKKRIIEEKREKLAQRVKEATENYEKGNVKTGTVDDLFKDLNDD